MVFKNKTQLENYLLIKCRSAVIGVERQVYDAIDRCLKQFYAQFTPEEYIRTEQLLHSLVKTDVKKVGNSYVAEVYFDESSLNYVTGYVQTQSGRTGYAAWDTETILDVTMTGSYSGLPHGGYASGTPIWTKSMAMLGDIYKLLKQELITLGVPIK